MKQNLCIKSRVILQVAVACFVLTSCQQATMSRTVFEQIPMGASIATVSEQAGSPYEVLNNRDGSKAYRYIERVEVGPNVIDQTTYTLKVLNGQVIDKEVICNERPSNLRTP